MSVNLHASCVSINGKGVLLLGDSGAGKSDLALRLIDDGAKLVADDRAEIFVRAQKLCARAPHSIAGLIELRGIGIIALPFVKSVGVVMAVRLQTRKFPRLPEGAFYTPKPSPGAHAPVPLIVVNAATPSATAQIRAALRAFSAGGFRDTFNE